MEEHQTPLKAARQRKSKNDEEESAGRQQYFAPDGVLAASAALYSPSKLSFKSMPSPQLLWLPRLPNEDSPLLIHKFQGNTHSSPALPHINSLPIATSAPPPSPSAFNFLHPLPHYGIYYPLKSSKISSRVIQKPISPIWSAKTGQNGPFKTIFGRNFIPPSKTTAPPPPPQLPFPLHHQNLFTFSSIVASKQEQHPVRYNPKNAHFTNDIKHSINETNIAEGSGGGVIEYDAVTLAAATALQELPLSSRPPHRRRKKPRAVQFKEPDLLPRHEPSTTTTTSEEGSHGHHGYRFRNRERKKVRWAGDA